MTTRISTKRKENKRKKWLVNLSYYRSDTGLNKFKILRIFLDLCVRDIDFGQITT
jgi:hypothetical protein